MQYIVMKKKIVICVCAVHGMLSSASNLLASWWIGATRLRRTTRHERTYLAMPTFNLYMCMYNIHIRATSTQHNYFIYGHWSANWLQIDSAYARMHACFKLIPNIACCNDTFVCAVDADDVGSRFMIHSHFLVIVGNNLYAHKWPFLPNNRSISIVWVTQ